MTDKHSRLEIATWVSWIAALLGAASWFMSLFMLFGNFGKWLKYGEWPSYKTGQIFLDYGFKFGQTDLFGLRKLIDIFMNTSAVSGMFILGFFTLFIFGMIIELVDRNKNA